jgi:methionine salvage enolase-phosphatase E1
VCTHCRGKALAEPLPSNDREIHIQIHEEGFMKYAGEMGSGAMIYILSSIKIGSGIQKLIVGIHRGHGDLISLLSFFQNTESRLKNENSPLSTQCEQLGSNTSRPTFVSAN